MFQSMKKALLATKLLSFSLIEVLLAISLFSILVMMVVGALGYGEGSIALAGSRSRAILLAEEGLEATRGIRNVRFSDLSDGAHGLTFADGKWIFQDTNDVTDNFTRQVTISSVSTSIKKIVSTVTWPQSNQRTGTISLETYLTNWMEIKPPDDWTQPTPDPPLPLPDNIPGTKLQTQGNYAYIVRNSPTANFIVVDITNPEAPQIKASLDLPGTPTNIALSDQYAYISNTDNRQNIQIINISNPEQPLFDPSQSFKGIGNEPGTSLVVSGNRIYMTREYKNISNSPTFYAIDISNPTQPRSLGYLRLKEPVFGLPVSGFDVYVAGNYAYVAAGFLQSGFGIIPYLQVIDISGSQPVLKKSYTPFNLRETHFGNAISVSGFGNTVVLGQESPGNEIYTYDVSTPETAALRGNYNTTGSVNDLAFGPNDRYVYLATGAPSKEFQLVDVSNLSSPTLFGKTDLPDKLNGVCYSPDKDRVFVVGNQGDGQFIVIRPQ